MAKGRKPKKSGSNDIEAYRHESETRKNAAPVGLASYDTSKPKPKSMNMTRILIPSLSGLGKYEE